MSNKEKFIEEVDVMLNNGNELSEEAEKFFQSLKAEVPASPVMTERGMQIIQYMQGATESTFTCKHISEGLGLASRSISGAMRKLVTDGFVEKAGKDTIIYSLTEKGKEFEIDNNLKI